MADDLLEAHAAIDWAETQMPVLEGRIKHWLEAPAYRLVPEPRPEMGLTLVVMRDVQQLPLIINAEVGAIINSLRSSLDLLATTLAERHNCLAYNEPYFPIAASEAHWNNCDFKGSEFFRSLPADATQFLHKVRPYRGGNSDLVALHDLDVMRKHKRLISASVLPTAVVVSPELLNSGFQTPTVWPAFENGSVIAWFNIGATEGSFVAPINVTFDERAILPFHPVMTALAIFRDTARDILKLFQ